MVSEITIPLKPTPNLKSIDMKLWLWRRVEVSCFSTTTADAINTAKPCRAACDLQPSTYVRCSVHCINRSTSYTTFPYFLRRQSCSVPCKRPLACHADIKKTTVHRTCVLRIRSTTDISATRKFLVITESRHLTDGLLTNCSTEPRGNYLGQTSRRHSDVFIWS